MPIYSFDGQVPDVAQAAWIAPDASLIGAVVLGVDASIWFGVVIRGDNSLIRIGARSNVQEGSVFHSDVDQPLTLGMDCTIGHGAVLHGCTIGDRVLIGMGAIILNGAVIGDDSIVGAGALVTECKSFDTGSLIVGSPARIVRSLDATAPEMLRASAARYVARAHRFAGGLVRVG